jgi:hypothetical protein
MSRRKPSAARRSSSKHGFQKRDLVKGSNATFYAKRSSKGRFKEMDERGRSQAADRRREAKTKAKSGYGDRGDRAA